VAAVAAAPSAQRQQAHRNRPPPIATIAAAAPSTSAAATAPRPPRPRPSAAQRPPSKKPARGYYNDDDSRPPELDDGARRELEGLVGLAMAREARLREEEAGGNAANGANGNGDPDDGVVEFGDVRDDDDFFAPSSTGGGGGGGRHAKAQPPWRQRQKEQQQPNQPDRPLQRRRGGELSRAAEPVPLAARGAIFGEEAQQQEGDNEAATTDKNLPSWSAERYAPKNNPTSNNPPTWPDLGLCSSLASHLEDLNFSSPTRVQRLAIPALLARRDALVRAATGSGKTLAYLAPIVHDLVERGSFLGGGGGGGGGNGNGNDNNPAPSRLSRSEGTYAVVLAPTRELAVQISDVLSAVLRRYPWIVSGLLVGGENRAHEKARLRKGVTALVATPGRLLDHLQNTSSFGVLPLRWLVLDEADRLLDMGFESKVREILGLVERRQREQAAGARASSSPLLPRRTTALLSATLHARLRALAELSLSSPVAVGFDPSELLKRLDDDGGGGEGGEQQRGEGGEDGDGEGEGDDDDHNANAKTKKSAVISSEWEMPATLRQAVVEVPARDRLAALIGALRARLEDGAGGGGGKKGDGSNGNSNNNAKIVVFLSTCDGVEFHHALLTSPHVARSVATGEGLAEGGAVDGSTADGGYGRALGGKKKNNKKHDAEDDSDDNDNESQYRDGVLGKGVAVLRLHGDMPQAERTSAFLRFAAAGGGGKNGDDNNNANSRGSVLLCTDVAARGLDFPRVTAIVQYDPPGDPADYVHRVGRTARMGQRGEALLFSLPSERAYSELLRERSKGQVQLEEAALEPLLRRCLPESTARALAPGGGGGGGGGSRFARAAATPTVSGAAAAGALSRRAIAAVAADPRLKTLASDAFRSFVRAYATHPAALKHIFHPRSLHLGQVAASCALKEPPAQLGASGSREERKRRKREEELKERQERRRRMHGGGEVVKRRKREEEAAKGGGGRASFSGARLE
jgi:ATP-dependent RNA helicase DDX31/DBP7